MGKRRPTRAGLVLISMLALTALLVLAPTALTGSANAQDDTTATAELTLSVSEAQPGETITIEGSGFRVGTDASFIYTSTITVGGLPIASVASVDPASGFLHAGRTNESGAYIAEHIHIDPADTTPDGSFTAQIVLPDDLPAGLHEIVATSCWPGPDESYPEDGVAPCGTVGLGGGVNDRVARATITIVAASMDEPAEAAEPMDDEAAPEPADTGNAGLGVQQDSGVPAGLIALMVVIAALGAGAGVTVHRLARRRA